MFLAETLKNKERKEKKNCFTQRRKDAKKRFVYCKRIML